METSLTTADVIKWLMADDSRISLFLKIVKARTVKIEINDQVKQLLDKGILKCDQYGTRLSEKGWKCAEAIEAIEYLDEIK